MTSPTGHAVLGASSSGRWLACPGSIPLSAGIKDNAGDSARWGTAAHGLASDCLEQDRDPEAFRGRVIEVEGHNYTVDSRMIEMVETYCNVIRGLVAKTGGTLLIEQRVDYSAVIGVPESFGTADAIILCDDGTIYVIDLKTGQRPVSPKSSQLKLYGLGALEDFGLVADFDKAVLVIVQPPKSDEPDCFEISVDDLNAFGAFARKQALVAASLIGVTDITQIEPHLVAGSHCHDYFCNARATCPKLRGEVSEAVFEDLDALEAESLASDSPTPLAIQSDPEHLAALYAKLDLIEGWCKEIREATYSTALEGKQLPGLKLVQGRAGNRDWNNKDQAEALLKSMRLKQDEMYKLNLQSPTQIEKVLKESPRRWAKVLPLISRSDGKPVLAPESDKREALVLSVAEDFDVVVEETDDLC